MIDLTLKHTLFIVLCILQALDILTTWRVLEAGGFEANPVAAKLMKALGEIPAMLLIKCAAVGIFGYYFAEIPEYAFGAVCAYMVWIDWRNVQVLRRMK